MNDDLDPAVRRALADILDRAPRTPDAPHDIAVLPTEHRQQRHTVLLVAAAAVAAVGIGGIVVTQRPATDPGPAAQPIPTGTATATSATTAPLTTTPSSIAAVTGVPTCGAELPVDVAIPSSAGPVNGPAVDPPAADGQFAQHWELPGGTIEIRWPADSRQVYDLEGTRGDPDVFAALSIGRPTDGSQAMVKVEHIDPATNATTDTMTITATSRTAIAAGTPGCALIQVRYIDHDANQLTVGYDVADFNAEPAFGVDLNPVVVATEDVPNAPVAGAIAACGAQVNNDIATAAAATPAEALVAYLETEAPSGLMRSGYHELHVTADDTVVYTWSNDQSVVTAITVTATDNGWTATAMNSAGC